MVDTARDPASIDLAERFVELHKQLRGGADAAVTMQHVVDLAVAAVPGCHAATIMGRPQGKRPRTLAASSEAARAFDELQIRAGDGPGVTAVTDAHEVRVADLGREQRWPAFTTRAPATSQVRSVLSLPIADADMRTAINLYGDLPDAFDDAGFAVAALFVSHVRSALLHARSSDKASNLAVALDSSRQIGMAVGILMQKNKLTSEQAFSSLQESSDRLHRKVNEIAVEVTETGALPAR